MRALKETPVAAPYAFRDISGEAYTLHQRSQVDPEELHGEPRGAGTYIHTAGARLLHVLVARLSEMQGEAHCKECNLDFDAANQFQSYVQSFAFQRQRVGLLYGKYLPDNKGVLIEAIYEPPQDGGPDRVTWNRKDPEIDKADAIATLLSMQRVRHPTSRGISDLS